MSSGKSSDVVKLGKSLPSVAVLLPPIELEPPLAIEQALLSEYAAFYGFDLKLNLPKREKEEMK